VRPLPAAILVSVASHAIALGWLAWSGRAHAMPLGATAPQSESPPTPATAAPEVIALVLLDAQTAPAPPMPPITPHAAQLDDTRPPRAVSPRDRRRETGLAIDAVGRDPDAAAATDMAGRRDEPSATPARSPRLTMRRAAPPELNAHRRSTAVFAPYE